MRKVKRCPRFVWDTNRSYCIFFSAHFQFLVTSTIKIHSLKQLFLKRNLLIGKVDIKTCLYPVLLSLPPHKIISYFLLMGPHRINGPINADNGKAVNTKEKSSSKINLEAWSSLSPQRLISETENIRSSSIKNYSHTW